MKIKCPGCGYPMFDISSLSEEGVKLTDLDGGFRTETREYVTPVIPSYELPVKSDTEVERSVAKGGLSGALTKADIKDIRQLYAKGYSLARIRQMLRLDTTMTRMQTIVNKPA